MRAINVYYYYYYYNNYMYNPALSKCSVAVGSIVGVVGSKHQAPLPARGLLVKSSME